MTSEKTMKCLKRTKSKSGTSMIQANQVFASISISSTELTSRSIFQFFFARTLFNRFALLKIALQVELVSSYAYVICCNLCTQKSLHVRSSSNVNKQHFWSTRCKIKQPRRHWLQQPPSYNPFRWRYANVQIVTYAKLLYHPFVIPCLQRFPTFHL